MNPLAKQEQADPGDVFQLSKENLIVIVFAKTNSPYFGLVVNMAKGASAYHEIKLEKTSIHTCVFERSPEQAARAITLLRYVESWATRQLFVAGRLVTSDVQIALATLECYQQACHCANADAHCLLLTDDAFKHDKPASTGTMMTIRFAMPGESVTPQEVPPKPKRYVMPCHRAYEYEKIEHDHPASWQDQVQAIAVRHETDWCPLFDSSKFRQYE